MKRRTEMIIQEVQKYPFLYDSSDAEFKNLALKTEKWNEIGVIVNLDGEMVKNKWRNLKDCYMKFRKMRENPSVLSEIRYSKWPWSSYFQFLDDTLVSIKKTPKKTESGASTSRTFINTNGPERKCNAGRSQQASSSRYPPPSKKPQPSAPKDIKIEESADDFKQMIDYFFEQKKGKSYRQGRHDEIDSLFLSYAQTLKRFSPKRQANMKMALANMFAQAELSELDEGQPSP